MLLRALLVIASGFIFIFSPGLPMNLISRYSPEYKRDLVYWGIGVWLVVNLLSQFSRSLLRPAFYPKEGMTGFTGVPIDFLFINLNALLSALYLGAAMLLVLKFKKKKEPEDDLLINGLALGFGSGLVAQIFTGITLVGAGFQVLFGNVASNVTVEAIANSNLGLLAASIFALILFRIALLVVSAVQGFLTAKSLGTKKGWFWVGALVLTLFTSVIIIIQLLMGEMIPGQISVGLTPARISIVTGLYYLAAFGGAYYWLTSQLKQHKN